MLRGCVAALSRGAVAGRVGTASGHRMGGLRWCSNGASGASSAKKPVSRARQIAREQALKRKSTQSTGAAAAEGDGESMAGLAAAAVLMLAAGASVAFMSESSGKWARETFYKGTPLETAGNFIGSKLSDQFKPFTDPLEDDLLPDAALSVPVGHKPPMTLVIDFEDTLCHLEWDSRNGWRAVKRPGADAFLRRLAMYYEIVLFTTGNRYFLEPFIESLDPRSGNIIHRLYRESTIYEDGEHVKDLDHLNRDLARVVVVDDNPSSVAKHQENLIPIKPFSNPQEPDTALLDLIPFLEDLARRDVGDVRQEIAKYAGKDLAKTFLEELKVRTEQYANQRKGGLGSMLRSHGIVAGGNPNPAVVQHVPAPENTTVAIPMTPIDMADKLAPLPPAQEAQPTPEAAPAKSGGLFSSLLK